jgi:uncharacterized protein YqjF (DUF2071 family)
MSRTSIFLNAEWRNLLMLNYAVAPDVLRPLVPHGTELDSFKDQAFLSVVGFQFLNTRIFGIPVPLHTNFEEVNLRFYVRRKTGDGWRRGVVFIRELVPSSAIALIARIFYREPYLAVPMRHRIDRVDGDIRVDYAWYRQGRWESLFATGKGEPQPIEIGSEEEFITEHYWGYTGRSGGCSEYAVEHPRWRVWRGIDAGFEANVSSLYGDCFVKSLAVTPSSVFIAEGSAIVVRRKTHL